MNYETLLVSTKDGITTVTLNRPTRLNSLTNEMLHELCDVFAKAASDEDTSVVVVTGAERAFCAGVDLSNLKEALSQIQAGKGPIREIDIEALTRLSGEMRSFEKPVIAAINGPAVGFGLTFSVACDIRIASEKATLCTGFLKVGLVPEFGSTYYLVRLLGIAKACDLAFTSRTVDAREAKELGLVNQVVPHEKLMSTAYEMAGMMASMPQMALRMAKKSLYSGLDSTLETQLKLEGLLTELCTISDDHVEGVSAFVQKRPAVFKKSRAVPVKSSKKI